MGSIFLTCDLDPSKASGFAEVEQMMVDWSVDHPMTYFLRYDPLIEERFGQSDYFLKKYDNWIEGLRSHHAFGWHPHFDIKRFEQDLDYRKQMAVLAESFPFDKISRIGMSYFSLELKDILVSSNYWLDSTCLAGKGFWAQSSESAFEIEPGFWEAPLSGFSAKGEPVRFLNLAYHAAYFEQALEIWSQKKLQDLVVLFHPEDLYRSNRLIAGDIAVVRGNVRWLESRFPDWTFRKLTEFTPGS